MTDVTIKATDGGLFSAYVALPAGSGPAPGMIVIQEIFGVNPTVRRIADDYAKRGYIAVAPDLFWRQGEADIQLDSESQSGWERAMKLYQGFSETKGIEDLIAALGWLRAHPRASGKAGAVGYCLGGKLAYLMATRSDADASVGYYGVGIDQSLGEATAITRPLMLHIAEKDGFVPPEAQAKIKAALAPITHVTLHSYPNVDHAFAREHGAHFNAAAADLADRRSAVFFDKALS